MKETYLSAFEGFRERFDRKNPGWIHSLHRSAISRFSELDFPTTRDEDWKYTSVGPIVKNSFRFIFDPAARGEGLPEIGPFLFGEKSGSCLVFVNGLYSKELSRLSNLPKGAKVGSLHEALVTDSELTEPHLAHYASFNRNAFTALNTAFIQEGAFVYLPKGAAMEKPIHLVFLSFSRDGKVISQPRNLILVEEGASAALIESFVSPAEDAYFTNTVTEILLKEGARLDHYKIQRESKKAFHVATTQVHQERKSRFTSFSFSFGAQLARSDLNVILAGEGSGCTLDGLYLVDHGQHVDHHTIIDHTQPQGTSRQFYKGILKGRSRAVFNGKIFVRPGAQETDAQQINKNLLLSEAATADTKPQLEIFADNVKCTHGAAVGQLDETAIFYLKSRGIDEPSARDLLTYGFALEVVDRVKLEAVRLELNRELTAWLQREQGSEILRGAA